MSAREKHRERGGRPQSLAEMMETTVSFVVPAEFMLVRVSRAFRRVAPPRVVANTNPARFSEGTLLLHCSTSAWASELSLMKRELVRALRTLVPELTDIVARVGPVPRFASARSQVDVRPIRRVLPEEVARALTKVRDDSLREAIALAASWAMSDADEDR